MTDEAFEQAVREHANTIFRVACHALKDRQEAEDVTQTVLLRLYQYGGEFQNGEHLKHWLLRVAVNESRKILRSPGGGDGFGREISPSGISLLL